MGEPNWIIIAIIGAVFGCALPYIVKGAIFAYKRFQKTFICGEWIYHMSINVEGKVKWVRGSIEINRGFLCEYSSKAVYFDAKYKGKGFTENNNLCINYIRVGDLQKYSSYHRYELSTIERRKNELHGFWLSTDSDKKVSSGAVILLRKEASDTELEQIAKDIYKPNKGFLFISTKN